ncbi:MAG: trypsin-like peptidase domain-containing protein [Gemmatimonadaceae bacterium]
MTAASEVALRAEAGRWLAGENGAPRWNDAVRKLLHGLRRERQFDLLASLAERAARLSPREPELRRLQAQALIEVGQAGAALDTLNAALRDLPTIHPEYLELTGLVGRAYKQMFVDAADHRDEAVRRLLEDAIAAYRAQWEQPLRPYWHGVNYLALRRLAARLEGSGGRNGDDVDLAREVFERAPIIDAHGHPDHWGLATRFEASLAFSTAEESLQHLKALLDKHPPAFNVGSLLRQLDQIWLLGGGRDDIPPMVTALRAYHARLPSAQIPHLQAADVARLHSATELDKRHLEAIFGSDGPRTMKWWKDGLLAAMSVAAIVAPDGKKIGTGFALSGRTLCDSWHDELIVLTNFHVCNAAGVTPGLHVDDAKVVFTATDGAPEYAVGQVLCESLPNALDFSVLKLKTPVVGVTALPIARRLPLSPAAGQPANRVFVIGHPDGRDLEFSVHDGVLLDVEKPPRPPDVRQRLHYRTPTENGNSGSPVFRSDTWQVLALHHAGGQMRRLNGAAGTYSANEGIAMASIQAEISRQCQS